MFVLLLQFAVVANAHAANVLVTYWMRSHQGPDDIPNPNPVLDPIPVKAHANAIDAGDATHICTETNVTANKSVTANFAADAPTLPVWCFHNIKQGVHFYTASDAEMQRVKDTLSTVHRYGGVGFHLAP